jgi:methanogenic corrinoid protein MtbC1
MRVWKLLVSAVVAIKEEKVLSLVRNGLSKGMDPYSLLEDVRKGLDIVADMYSKGDYFLADLVMAAEIYKEVQQLILGSPEELNADSPQIVFGTVEKDIHDIGKNIAIVTMRQYGLAVQDLGVDVSPDTIVNKVQETRASILCMSGLISDAYDSMKKTVNLLTEKMDSLKPITIIGGLVNDAVCRYTGVDYWVKNCTDGASLCLKILREAKTIPASDSR